MKKIFFQQQRSAAEYESIREAMEKRNFQTLTVASGLATIILLCLFSASFFVPALDQNRELYDISFKGMGIIFLLTRTVLRKKGHWILPVYYIFLLCAFLFGTILGVYLQPDIPATSFCVFLFAMPLLIIDKPYRVSILLLGVSLIFITATTQVKAPELASLDRVNVISFFFLSIAVDWIVMQTKINELLARKQVEKERDTDSLTRLMTKTAAIRTIQEYLNQKQEKAAMLIIDIDNFKQVNDRMGHAYGDAVLRIMGECIAMSFREGDVMGRFGGDEFVIFLPGIKEETDIRQRVEKLFKNMSSHLQIPEKAVRITGSIGIAFYPEHAVTYEELFEKADQALYCSKGKGKNCYTFYLDKDLQS